MYEHMYVSTYVCTHVCTYVCLRVHIYMMQFCTQPLFPLVSFSLCSILIEALSGVDPTVLSDDERLAFWINLYNALVLWVHLQQGPPPTMGKWIQRLRSACYTVGGVAISAMEIEHSLLRARSHRSTMARTLKMKLFEKGDPRAKWTCVQPEPFVSFALAPGTRSAPPVRKRHVAVV